MIIHSWISPSHLPPLCISVLNVVMGWCILTLDIQNLDHSHLPPLCISVLNVVMGWCMLRLDIENWECQIGVDFWWLLRAKSRVFFGTVVYYLRGSIYMFKPHLIKRIFNKLEYRMLGQVNGNFIHQTISRLSAPL